MTTLNEALDALDAPVASGIASGKLLTKQLMDLAVQVTRHAAPEYQQGSVTLLYNGQINGIKSGKYVQQIVNYDADIRVLDKTQSAKLLADDKFKKAWLGVSTEAGLFNSLTGPWAKAS